MRELISLNKQSKTKLKSAGGDWFIKNLSPKSLFARKKPLRHWSSLTWSGVYAWRCTDCQAGCIVLDSPLGCRVFVGEFVRKCLDRGLWETSQERMTKVSTGKLKRNHTKSKQKSSKSRQYAAWRDLWTKGIIRKLLGIVTAVSSASWHTNTGWVFSYSFSIISNNSEEIIFLHIIHEICNNQLMVMAFFLACEDFGDNIRHFMPRLQFFFFLKWILGRAH